MIFRTIVMISILASGNQAQAAQSAALKLNSGKNLKAAKLLMNMASVNDWTQDFIGQRTFELMDDSIYATQYQNLKNLEAELLRVRGMLNDKKNALDLAISNKNKKVAELQTANTSLSDKNKLKTDTEKEVILLNTENTAHTNSISSNQNLITAQTDEVQKLSQEFTFWKGEFDNSVISMNAKQAAYDAAFAACQAASPTADCTQDKDVVYARTMLNQVIERKNYLETQKNAVAARLDTANGKITKANADIKTAQAKIEENTAKIKDNNSVIATLGTEIPALIAKSGSLTAEIKDLSAQEVVLVDDVKRMTSIEQSQGASYQAAVNSFDKMKSDLISQIIAFNRAGYDKSAADGAQEGIETANNIGGGAGTTAGRAAGSQKGEADGRARDFQIGARQGEGDGARDGSVEGAKAGTLEGKQAGFKAAGSKEGEASGINKAVASDAAAVGKNLGNQAGLQRAQNSGRDQGYRTGEVQAIQDQENDVLANFSINGQFSGTFQSGMPGFPGANGKYFNSSQNNTRKVLQQAYVAGYNVAYAPAAEKVYYENVKAIYDSAYGQSYSGSYNLAFAVTYEDSIRQGRGAQYAAAYDREYKLSYSGTYKASYDQGINQPDRNGSIFINAFKTSESSTYASKYEQIKGASYSDAEKDTFNQNIGSQTEKFRQERLGQVNKIYANFPVLKFISSAIQDAGIRGVAAGDAFFMPGEDVIHNITIANYGSAAATGVKVVLKTGEAFTLPSIAGKSVVTIKGAGKEKIAVSQAIGSNIGTNLVTKFALSAQEKNIQGRHYASPADGSLNSGDAKSFSVDYPIQVSSLSLLEPLVLKKNIGLKAVIVNRSQKDFNDIDLELDSNLNAIAQKFSKINFLDQSITKTDAIINVSSDDDMFKDVAFNLTVKISDVVVGKLQASAKDFVRVPFKAIAGAPVVVLNSASEAARDIFKDLAHESGGVEKLSVLDLAAFNENQGILDSKLSGKTVIAIDQGNDSIFSKMGGFLKTSNVAAIVLTEGEAQNSMQSVKKLIGNSTSLTLKMFDESFQVVSSAQILNGIPQKVSFVAAKFNNLESALKVSQALKLSDDALLTKIGAEISKDTFLAKADNDVLLTKVLGIRVLEDAIQMNIGYQGSKKGFIFLSKEQRAWKNKADKDESLLVNKIEAKMKNANRDEKLAISLAAMPVQGSIENLLGDRDQMEKKIRKATLKSIDDFKSDAKKNFKVLGSKGLEKSIEAIESSFYAGF
ncbi:MAG: hypothetical protein ACOYL6_01385 [Bacteriovoracaceae bacterium]